MKKLLLLGLGITVIAKRKQIINFIGEKGEALLEGAAELVGKLKSGGE